MNNNYLFFLKVFTFLKISTGVLANSLQHSPDFSSDAEERRLWNILWTKEKMLAPRMFSTLSKTEIIILATFNLTSANAFSLIQSKILWFRIEVKLVKILNLQIDQEKGHSIEHYFLCLLYHL